MFSPLLTRLIEELQILPGVGPKTAQRMAFHLLQQKRSQGLELGGTLAEALGQIKHCKICRNFTEQDTCNICSNPKRNKDLVCIAESPADVFAIEQTQQYNGLYFVLMGHLSPLDGMGPEQLGLTQLQARLKEQPVAEIVLATNTTLEGEATAHYIANLVKPLNIPCTRLAHGIPMGGELEYLDGNTLSRAFIAREVIGS